MKRFFLIIVVLTLLIPTAVYAQGNDPWSEVFQPDGNLNPDLIDLGVTTDHPDWMSIELPFGNRLTSMLITIATRPPVGTLLSCLPLQLCSLWP